MTESIEVSVARMQEQLKVLVDGTNEARESRREQARKLDDISTDLAAMKVRIDSVEQTLAGNQPTIAEFTKIKHQVTGAGIAGKWLWGIGGILIGLAFTGREFIRKWLTE